MEVLPLYTLSPQEQGSSIITVEYSSKSCKIHFLSEKKYVGKPKIKGETNKNWNLLHLEWQQVLNAAQLLGILTQIPS